MKFEPIVSSNLDSAAYDAENSAIFVRFVNGSTYRYPNCDAKLWKAFRHEFDGKQGRSAGKFMHAKLRVKPYDRVDDWK